MSAEHVKLIEDFKREREAALAPASVPRRGGKRGPDPDRVGRRRSRPRGPPGHARPGGTVL